MYVLIFTSHGDPEPSIELFNSKAGITNYTIEEFQLADFEVDKLFLNYTADTGDGTLAIKEMHPYD